MILLDRETLERTLIRYRRMEGKEVGFVINRDATIMDTAYFGRISDLQAKKTK